MNNLFEYRNCFKEFEDVKSHLIIGGCVKISPKVSILMPVYSHTEFFEKALVSAINQDYKEPYEILVVDNNPIGSNITDYQRIIEKHAPNNISYYRNEKNIGLFGNWNRCVELAKGEFVTFLHDDDELLPNCLVELMKYPAICGQKLVFPQQNTIDGNGIIIERSLYHEHLLFLRMKDYYPISLLDKFICNRGCGVGCLYSKQAIVDLGGYNKEYDPSSDYALNIRYVERFGAIETSKVLINYRRAVNYSYDCYNRWPSMDLFLRKSILEREKRLNFITSRVLKAFYRREVYGVTWQFGKGDAISRLKDKPNRFDWFLWKLVVRLSRIRYYAFC